MSTEQLSGRRNFVRNLAVGLTAVPISGMAQTISTGGSFSDVRDLEVAWLRSAKLPPEQVVIRTERVENVPVTSCAAPDSSRALLEVRGAGSQDVVLALNRVPKGVQEVAFAEGADTSVVEKRA